MKNTGLEYELLVRSIFQEIHSQDAAKTIEVQHNVELIGKSGATHQIDIYWEFEIGEIKYLSIVQCKDWNSRVKQEQVFAFKTVLEDLPKQPRGIIISKKGFQKGAKRFAAHHGIELFELIEEGELTNITLDSALFELSFGSVVNMEVNLEKQGLVTTVFPGKCSNLSIKLNEGWKRRKVQALGHETVNNCLNDVPNLDSTLFDLKYKPIKKMKDVFVDAINGNQEHSKHLLKNNDDYQSNLKYEFKSPTYFSTNSRFLPFVRIQSVNFDFKVTRNEPYLIPFIKTGITQYILRNIIDGREAKVGISSPKTP